MNKKRIVVVVVPTGVCYGSMVYPWSQRNGGSSMNTAYKLGRRGETLLFSRRWCMCAANFQPKYWSAAHGAIYERRVEFHILQKVAIPVRKHLKKMPKSSMVSFMSQMSDS